MYLHSSTTFAILVIKDSWDAREEAGSAIVKSCGDLRKLSVTTNPTDEDLDTFDGFYIFGLLDCIVATNEWRC